MSSAPGPGPTSLDPPRLDNVRDVVRRALRDALGLPCVILIASMTGFGTVARDSGFDLGLALVATAGIWGLPGQLALVELYAAGSGLAAMVAASSLANARFLPMAVSFLPLLRAGLRRPVWMFPLVQLMSINSWVAGLRAFPRIDVVYRAHYYVVFALTIMTAGLVGTTLGYFSLHAMPRPLALGLIFLNPCYFALLFAGTRSASAMLALALGAVLGPATHLLSPDWGLLLAGFVGGTVAFLLLGRNG